MRILLAAFGLFTLLTSPIWLSVLVDKAQYKRWKRKHYNIEEES